MIQTKVHIIYILSYNGMELELHNIFSLSRGDRIGGCNYDKFILIANNQKRSRQTEEIV